MTWLTKTSSIIPCIVALLLGPVSAAQDLSGDYTMVTEEGTLSLILRQDAQGGIVGTLTGANGQRFNIEGVVEDGVGVGVCSGNEIAVFFETQAVADVLQFVLIEPNAYNMPDYSTARQLQFARRVDSNVGTSRRAPQSEDRPPAGAVIAGTPNINSNEVGDPSWGFKFVPPRGWKFQYDESGVLLGHDTIAGLIRVIPHHATDQRQLAQQMQEGVSEDGVYLSMTGSVGRMGGDGLVGDYSGTVNGETAKARAIGTISPFGGGAHILALTTPQMFGDEIVDAANAIVESIQYFSVDVSDLVAHFAGRWASYSGNSGGGTLTNFSLFRDGTCSDDRETSYNVNQADSHFEATGISGAQARWTIRGTKERGQIIFSDETGEMIVNYEVFVEKGQTYWTEYLFDGQHFAKQESF